MVIQTLLLNQKIDIIRHHPCFSTLTYDEAAKLASLLAIKQIAPHDIIVKEGNIVDSIYFIVAGKAEVSQEAPIALMGLGEAIGLSDTGFYSSTGTRSATVKAITDMALLRLDIAAFNAFLQNHPHIDQALKENANLLQRLNLIKRAAPFNNLSIDAVKKIASDMQEVNTEMGQIIFNKDEEGDKCYLIQSGKVEIFIPETNGTESRLAVLNASQIFGEAALLMKLPRNASARVIKEGKLLALSREVLLEATQTHANLDRALINLLKSRCRPIQLPHIECFIQHHKNEEESVITLKNDQNGTYYRLAEEGLFIWKLLDGKHSLRDLTLAFNKKYNIFDTSLISNFIMELDAEGFIESKSGEKLEKHKNTSFIFHTASAIKKVMEASVSFKNVDAWITKMYNNGFFILYTLPAQLIISFFALTGFITFIIYFRSFAHTLNITPHSGWLIFTAIIATMTTTIFHELAHAFTTKAFGRKIKAFGVGWFWIGPMAFCDTSDMWLNNRKQRVAVDLAGLYWDSFLAGTASFIALCISNEFLSLFFWLFALMHYLSIFSNLSPNIELDGYYTLMDLTGVDNLRESAIQWLIHDGKKLWQHPRLILKHKALAVYWLTCIFYILLEVIVPYIILNVLLYGVLGVQNPYITLILTLIVVFLSSLSLVGEICAKTK